MLKDKLNSISLVSFIVIILCAFALMTTVHVSAAEDIYTDNDIVSFSGGGGTCTLYATLTYSAGSYVSTNRHYVKNPKSGYTVYTTTITTTKDTSRKMIWVKGSCAQAKSQPSNSNSYTAMQVTLKW